MIARYHMYQAVYCHKAVSAFELMLRKIYEELLKEGKVLGLNEILEKVDENQATGICPYDDSHVLHAINYYEGKNEFLKELIEMLSCREPLSRVREEPAFTAKKGRPSILSLLFIQEQKNMLANEAKIEDEWIFPMEVRPIHLSESPIKVQKDGDFIPLDEDKTSIVSVLAKHTYNCFRIYTKEDFKDSVGKAIKKLYKI